MWTPGVLIHMEKFKKKIILQFYDNDNVIFALFQYKIVVQSDVSETSVVKSNLSSVSP